MKKNNALLLLTCFGMAGAISVVALAGKFRNENVLSLREPTEAKPATPVVTVTAAAPQAVAAKQIQLALLLDTSNSMDGLIEQAKSQLWNIVDELAEAKHDGQAAKLSIALYEYGNDNLSMRKGYVRQVSPFTDDLDEISQQLFALKTNGGSEYCGTVIQQATEQLEWNEGKEGLKMVFIAGNEAFNQGAVDFKLSCAAAAAKDIVVNTIFCGHYQEGINTFWKKGAQLAKGDYMNIDMDAQTVYVATPYDDQIDALNDRLNDTYVSYGKIGATKKQQQLQQDLNSSSYSKENKVKRAISKSKHVYTNTQWDLIDAQKEKDFDLKSIKTADLPQEMRSMSLEERQDYLAQKKAERAKVKQEIQALAQQRKAYVQQVKDSSQVANELENALLKTVKEKAKQKQLTFE